MNRFGTMILFALSAAWMVAAQSTSPSDHLRLWHSSDFERWTNELRGQIPRSGQNFAIRDVDVFGKHQIRFIHLIGNGNPEMHEKKVVIYIVQNGEGTILNGGKLVNPTPRTDDPRRWRGTGIEGARSYGVRKGDVFKFPNGEAHQILVAPGETLTAASLVIDVQ
jgi:mannose-6-phosphate isomerase-like protein (cupin superfamily)